MKAMGGLHERSHEGSKCNLESRKAGSAPGSPRRVGEKSMEEEHTNVDASHILS